jgi:catechol 2,3-dioxygenase-like lactoylglutathione lyase family enzyme
MKLGKFSISLTVQDLIVSRKFYEALGFEVIGGDESQQWLMLQQGENQIGLFQKMFPKNLLTFNPGPEDSDVRDIQAALLAAGVEVTLQTDTQKGGPGHISLEDPDGNQILIDQHQ